MRIVSQNALAGLSKATVENCTKIRIYREYFTRSMNPNIVEFVRNPHLSYAVYCQLYRVQKRFKGSSSKKNTSENMNDDYNNSDKYYSSSSSHQRYNRDRYEHRRSYGGGRDTSENSESQKKRNEAFNSSVNHYQRLNVDPNSNIDSIKSAYYSMSKLYHPDIVGADNEQAAENFRLITESYDTLSNPEARSSYDRQLAYESSQLFTSNPLHSVSPNTNFNPIFRTRDADMIFRTKLEAAIQREKLKDPKKFRAGSFVNSENLKTTQLELNTLEKRLHDLQRSRSSSGRSRDGSDFYRQHLYNSLFRKKSDLLAHHDIDRKSRNSPDDSTGIIAVCGILVILSIVILNLLMDIDFASTLDDKLQRKLDIGKKEKEKDED